MLCPSSCSVSNSEGKLVVTEVATRPLTQNLLSHEVRGSGDPQPHRLSPCTQPALPQAGEALGAWGWPGGKESVLCLRLCSPAPPRPHPQAPTLGLSLPPVGLLYPGPGGPEDLCVEGEELQHPGEDGGHESGTGGHGDRRGEGERNRYSREREGGSDWASHQAEASKALGPAQLGVLRVCSVAPCGGRCLPPGAHQQATWGPPQDVSSHLKLSSEKGGRNGS